MKDDEFYIILIKFITHALLDKTENESQALKILTLGVNSALKERK